MIYLGIDPGLSGGIGALDSQGRVLLAERMPLMASYVKGKRMVDCHALRGLLMPVVHPLVAECRAAVEAVTSMPQQGVASMFSFGGALGAAYGTLAGLGIGFEFVPPKTWKRLHGLNKDKAQSLAMVSNRWPGLHLIKADDGVAEALLIADWLRQQ